MSPSTKDPGERSIRVVGTAGHVDHGKSSLIEALTGTHPDRLTEEQARQMTIELGFAWLRLADGREVGIIDVPGHRDFIDNMLAGVAGIDTALLVIAADEGVMPQTVEHLAIIDLLQIPGGVIALTKADLVPSEDRLAAVENAVRAAVRGTVFAEAPIVRVSTLKRTGLSDMLEALKAQLDRQSDRPDLGRPRLALDRIFVMEGFGTVVTGTLTDGKLAVGEEVEILPSGLRGRIRGLQNHGHPVEICHPGSRTAVNISGIPASDLRRGDVLCHPGQYETTRRIDARLRLLQGASTTLSHHAEVKVFVGASQSMATVRLLDVEELRAGQASMVQLELRRALVCARGDAFIIRRPSPGETLGGGNIIEARPPSRHKRFEPHVLASLRALADGAPADVLLQAARATGLATLGEIIQRSRLAAEQCSPVLKTLIDEGKLVPLDPAREWIDPEQLLIPSEQLESVVGEIERITTSFHSKFPLRGGIPREELRSQLRLPAREFNLLIGRSVAASQLEERGKLLALPGHAARLSSGEEASVQSLMNRFEASPYSPPSVNQCIESVGAEVFAALRETGMLVVVSEDVVFRKGDYDLMVSGIRSALAAHGSLTLAEVRDLYRTSRRYAQALLEHLDAAGLTRRDGDTRRLAN